MVDALKEAVFLIKSGRKIEARRILEPIIVSNPQNIQAWIWEIETRETNAEKIKLMEACLLHNPDAAMIKKALAAIKTRQEFLAPAGETEKQPLTEVSVTGPAEKTTVAESEEAVGTAPLEDEFKCPYCGATLEKGAQSCEFCGRDLQEPEPEIIKQTAGTTVVWYRRNWVKFLMFIFLFPIGCGIELADPNARKSLKILSGILLVLYINLLSLSLYWLFTTNSTRINPLNLFRVVTGQGGMVPGTVLNVEGSVQNPGTASISAVEIQARAYDADGNLIANDSRYLDSSSLTPGVPVQFQLDVPSLTSPLGTSLLNRQVLFFDDFSSPSSGWGQNTAAEGETAYIDGHYRLTVNAANYDLWSNPGRKFTDTRIEVDATKINGPENNRFGVQCRYVDPDNYYFAVISSDGYYGIGKVVNGEQSFLRENGMLVTDRVFPGSAINHIRFDCDGSRLTLYLNDDYVDAVDDKDLTSGDVGLLAGDFNDKGTQILFDNLVVLKP